MSSNGKVQEPQQADVSYITLAIQIETEFIGAILLDPKVLEVVVDRVKPHYFSIPKHQKIYDAMVNLHSEGKKPELIAVAYKLMESGSLREIGGHSSLATYLNAVITSATIESLADYVLQCYQDRKVRSLADNFHATADDLTLSPEEKIKQLDSAIASIRIETSDENKSTQSMEEIALDYFAYLEKLQDGDEEVAAVPTGFYDLDTMLGGGLGKGDLIIVAGRPSMGKSCFVQQILYEIARKGTNGILFSLEMDKRSCASRLLAGCTGIPASRLRTGKFSASEWQKISQAMDELTHLPLCICDKFSSGWESVAAEFKRRQLQYGKFSILVVDYLQLMADSSDPRLVYVIGEITRRAKLFAQEYNIPVILLSQLSRSLESRANKRPVLSDLRDSGRIEEDADVVISLYRDEYYDPSSPEKGLAEISVQKHRNGATGTVKLLFEPELTRFKNLLGKGS